MPVRKIGNNVSAGGEELNGVLLKKIEKLIRDPAEAKCLKTRKVTGQFPHIHAEWEIKFFADGVLLVPPRTVHDASSFEKDGFLGAILLEEDFLIAPMDEGAGSRLLRIRRDGKTRALEKLLEALSALPEEEKTCRDTLAGTFFRLLKKAVENGETTSADPDKAQETAVFLEQYYYRTDLGVGEIASRMGVTQQYLNKLFKARCGRSLLSELNRIRLRHARELLLSGSYLVSEAARLTGWRNAFYFSRVYRNFYGFPPKETLSRISSGKITY